MHFWIDKSKFGSNRYSFRGRHRHRPIGVGRVHRWRSPKPMVTPVHRFASSESVTPSIHNNLNQRQNHHHHHHQELPPILHSQSSRINNSYVPTQLQISDSNSINSNNIINIEDNITTMFIESPAQCQQIPYRSNIKMFGIVPSLVLGIVLIGYTKFYFDTQRGGYEMVTIIAMIGIVAIIWHTIYKNYIYTSNVENLQSSEASLSTQILSIQQQTQQQNLQEPNESIITSINATIPPPAYHIAILLPTNPKDIPPPSYDIAVNQKNIV